jgi:hypothetical protein
VPFEPEIPLVLTAVYSRDHPVARIVVNIVGVKPLMVAIQT